MDGVCPEFKRWSRAKVVKVKGDRALLRWAGWETKYDSWVKKPFIRPQVIQRTLARRKSIKPEEWPTKTHPRNLVGGDKVLVRGEDGFFERTIKFNDPFLGMVRYIYA